VPIVTRNHLVAAAVAVSMVCTGGVIAGTPAAADPAVAAQVSAMLDWQPCFPRAGQFQCATLPVPLDYGQPSGNQIPVAVIRQRATDPAHRIGSLVLNPGGPGGSGVDLVRDAGPFIFNDEVRARFDIVSFDPRGIARSRPLRCFDDPSQWEPYFKPFAFPSTRAQEQLWIATDRYLLQACDQRAGAIINHMSTANVARDMDMLRQALGDPKLNYVGVSYGSYLGVTYANLFPDHFRALVVDGVLDPIQWATGSGDGTAVPFSTRLRSDAGAQATLNEFFRLCDAAGRSACAFAPRSAKRFAALGERLKDEPVVIKDPVTGDPIAVVDYSIFIAVTLGAMYFSPAWPDFAHALAELESVADDEALRAALQSVNHQLGLDDPALSRYRNELEGFPGVACSDTDNPNSYQAWSRAGAAADANFGYFGRIWTWASSLCAEWRGRDAGRYTGPFNTATAAPVLVVGNLFDPATRYEGAVTVNELLPNSRLLTVNGWGHTSIGLSACADAIEADYLLTGALPAQGQVCQQDNNPFAPPAAESASRTQAARVIHAITIPLAVPATQG
jgi:pimeloyl-ACP methyl ester carboxylesterase